MMRKILVLDRADELAEHVRVALETDPTLEVIGCNRIGSIDHLQEHDGPFTVLVAGPSLATHAGLARLAEFHRRSPNVAIVMTFASRPDATLREIVRVGALDVLELPADAGTLRTSIADAVARAETVPSAVEFPLSAPSRAPARVFTVCSATGGCGKTFYSTNLSTFLARNSGGRVALLDLDLQFGEISTALRLQPSYTIVDALAAGEDAPMELGARVEECMVRVEENLWALAAPRDPEQADRVTPHEVTKVITSLRYRFDTIIVDTPTAMAETVLAAFDLSEQLFVMATLDLPSIRNLGLFVRTLEKLRIPGENVSLLLNKVETDIGVELDQLNELFPQGFRSRLPYAKEVSRSINLGTPVIAAFPESQVARELVAGITDLLPEDRRAAFEPAPARRRRFSFRRRPAVAVGGGAA